MNGKLKPYKVRPRPSIRPKIRTTHPANQTRSESPVPFLETEIGYDDRQENERYSAALVIDEQLMCDINGLKNKNGIEYKEEAQDSNQ